MRTIDASLPHSWKKWVLEQLLRNVPPVEIIKILLAEGFLFEACKKALGSNVPANLKFKYDEAFYQRLARPAFLTSDVVFEDKSNEFIQQFVVPDFLNKEESAGIVELAKQKLRPSEISTEEKYSDYRTSSTCDLTFLTDDRVKALEDKIVNFMGLGVGENEVMQAQHYAVGQEFKKHTDYFEPGSQEWKAHAAKRGQRTWTFMIYLSDECEGGETDFLIAKQKFVPKTGTAVIWNNLFPNGMPNPNTLHRSIPVSSGEKNIITKWFRTHDQ